jgi:hypothetical protein
MAFWNRWKKNARQELTPIARAIVDLRDEVLALRNEVADLRKRGDQPVPSNGGPRAGSAVQDWLPVVDRFQELLLVQMGNADLAQAFGTCARQRELREAEEPDTTWTEPNGSTYENL